MREFKKVSYCDDGVIPTRSDNKSCGYDFYSTESFVIEPHKSAVIPTYIKAYMEDDEFLLLDVRSSIGIKKHLMLCNTVGIIDASYVDNKDNEGNIQIALYNYGDDVQYVMKGDRIAQGIFVKYLLTNNDIALSDHRDSGIGSSGN